jgi:y4mF family transcriptional regulator
MLTVFAKFVKDQRKKLHWTQKDLAKKAKVGLRFIRDMEQGKKSLRLDKVNQVLELFDYEAGPVRLMVRVYRKDSVDINA